MGVPVSTGSGASGAGDGPMTAPAPSLQLRYGERPAGQRSAMLLALALHVFVALILIYQKREPLVKMAEQGLTTFNIAPEAKKGSETDKTERQETKKEVKQAASQDQAVPAETPPPPEPPPPVVRDFQPNFLVLSRSDFAASDIGKRPSERSALAAASAQGDSKAPYGPGTGPGGATLYPADWYREPTDTELGGYLRPDMPRRGWGEIACKTVARYRVDECYIIGEFPRGSGFARSVLDSSWQFQVLPPRVNGRTQVGTWVRIRITYTDGKVTNG